MKRIMRSVLVTWVLILAGCSSGVESGPVNLPVPFAGDLRVDTRVVNSNGSPIAQGTLFGHPSGQCWDLTDPSGRVGSFCFVLDSMTPPVIDSANSNKRTFTVTACFDFESTFSSVCSDLQYIDFFLESPVPSTFDLEVAAPGEVGVKEVRTRGVASAPIKFATGLFEGAVGQIIQYNYVFGWVEHTDGTRTFFQHDVGTSLIQGFGGVFE